jgi:hypothetical protein
LCLCWFKAVYYEVSVVYFFLKKKICFVFRFISGLKKHRQLFFVDGRKTGGKRRKIEASYEKVKTRMRKNLPVSQKS